jgi:hypothetical protein
MAEFTQDGVYIPRRKVAIASSFEGILNNGATECGLTSLNAYQQMDEGKGRFFGKIVEPEYFDTIKGSKEVQAFLRLRPLVELAEDYLTVLEVIDSNPALVGKMLSDPLNESAYDPLIDKFNERRAKSKELRAKFKKAFYDERSRMQKKDYNAWLGTQSPFEDSLVEMRYLVRAQKRNKEGDIESGFVPWFATSKDEKSTYGLCVFYGRVMKLDPEDIGEDGKKQCMITKDRIIGDEHIRDKVEQLKIIALTEDIPRSQVWRLNDRYDKAQQIQLRDDGFPYQFLLAGGGYAFPHDVKKALEDPLVIVIARQGFAKALGAHAEKWNF